MVAVSCSTMHIAMSRSVFHLFDRELKAGESCGGSHTLGGWYGLGGKGFNSLFAVFSKSVESFLMTVCSNRLSALNSSSCFSPFSPLSALVRSLIALIAASAVVIVGWVVYLCLKLTVFDTHSLLVLFT